MMIGHLENTTNDDWSFGEHYKWWLVIWRTLQMMIGHLENTKNNDWVLENTQNENWALENTKNDD